MTAIKYTWDTGSMDRIKKSFLHHKLEAIKFVNEQLQNPGMAATDCIIASIAALALAEVSFMVYVIGLGAALRTVKSIVD